MISTDLIVVLFVSFLPGVELRGSVPLGIALGLNPVLVILASIVANIILIPVVFLFLALFWKIIKDWWFIETYVSKLRERSNPYVDKYGSLGVYVFVAIPLPGSGVYTGCLVSWLFGMNKRDVFLPIVLGVLTAATVIALLSMGVVTIL